MTLAGMDLMGAVRSLVARAAGGDVGAIREGLRATLASQEELHARGAGIGGPPAGEGAIGRAGTDLMRQLEEALRELGRGRPGA
jgi:hypothetical protein